MLDTIVKEMEGKAAAADPIGNSIKFDFGDSCIHIDGTGDSNVLTTEDKEADCTIGITQEDLASVAAGDLNPMMAVMSGKIKIDGDMSVAMKLQTLLG